MKVGSPPSSDDQKENRPQEFIWIIMSSTVKFEDTSLRRFAPILMNTSWDSTGSSFEFPYCLLWFKEPESHSPPTVGISMSLWARGGRKDKPGGSYVVQQAPALKKCFASLNAVAPLVSILDTDAW